MLLTKARGKQGEGTDSETQIHDCISIHKKTENWKKWGWGSQFPLIVKLGAQKYTDIILFSIKRKLPFNLILPFPRNFLDSCGCMPRALPGLCVPLICCVPPPVATHPSVKHSSTVNSLFIYKNLGMVFTI